jgi:hypothetical protein
MSIDDVKLTVKEKLLMAIEYLKLKVEELVPVDDAKLKAEAELEDEQLMSLYDNNKLTVEEELSITIECFREKVEEIMSMDDVKLTAEDEFIF